MINYKNLIKTFESQEIEKIKSFVDLAGITGQGNFKKLLHKLKKVLKYYAIKNIKSKMIGTEKRKLDK